MYYDPEQFHVSLYPDAPRVLRYNGQQGDAYTAWRDAVREKYISLLCMPNQNGVPVPRIEFEMEHPPVDGHAGYTEIRYTFESEPGYIVPCHLLLPYGEAPFATMLCLQGHTNGMHVSLGRALYPGDAEQIAMERDYAMQCVDRGMAALCMEVRGFGESKGGLGQGCHHASMQALMLGRTMQGERVYDCMRAIDTLSYFPKVDANEIYVMGDSGGGMLSYNLLCADPRIKGGMPICSFSTYEGCFFHLWHCACNYIPHILEYFGMEDYACLIAPRPLVVVNGASDPIFLISESKKAYRTVLDLYAAAGAAHKVEHVIGDGGHRFFADVSWAAFDRVTKK